jgi:hypothetical protein
MKALQLWVALPWLLAGCANTMPQHTVQPSPTTPRAGDLLLLDLECPECDAIAGVTKAQFGVDGPSLSHVGLVVSHEGIEVVLEAWPDPAPGKVQTTSISSFISRARGGWGKPRGAYGLRFGPPHAQTAALAAKHGLKHLGRPYDDKFMRENTALYCAELVYQAFREASGGREVFTLTPMTFGQPGSPAHAVWHKYYQARNLAIPEGAPGISPLGVYLKAVELGAHPVRYRRGSGARR